MCTRTDACGIADPTGAIRWLAHLVAAHPVRGQVELPGGAAEDVIVDEPEVANLLQSTGTCPTCGQIDPPQLLAAITSLRRGDPQPLLRIADLHSLAPPDGAPDPVDFSASDNFAAFCNDQDFVWERTDPVRVRMTKFREAVSAFPPDAFAPFTVDGWMAFTQPAGCLGWPAPDRFEPAVPAGVEFPKVPALILAGDSDTVVPGELVETLHAEFPDAAFVTVAGAGHPVVGPAWGDCAAELVAQMFDKLRITDSACATTTEA